VIKYIEEYLENGKEPLEIVNRHMIPAIIEVGQKYDTREYFLPQLMMSAEAMKKGFTFLEPRLKEKSESSAGKVLLATVKGDVHDIGKNIVNIMFSNHGFEVIDLGKDIDSEKILDHAVKNNVNIIGLSALMTTTMEEMGRFMKLAAENNVTIPVMIGGAVVNEDYAKSIGAYYAKDAVRAVETAKNILKGN
jgi:5-methyltetrahydrofolate--homocysteine methyltransferase